MGDQEEQELGPLDYGLESGDDKEAFRLNPDQTRSGNRRLLIMMGIYILVIVGVAFYTGGDVFSFSNPSSFIPVAIPLLLYVFLIIRRQRASKKAVSSYVIWVEEDGITKTQEGLKDISLNWDEIKTIKKTKRDVFVVEANNALYSFVIPKGLERADEFEALVAKRVPVEKYKMSKKGWVYIGRILGLGGSLFACLITDNVSVLIAAAIVGLGFTVWSVYETILRMKLQQRPNIIPILALIAIWGVIISRFLILF